MSQTEPFSILLDNVRSALNVGAIFRTCDGAGVSTLYLGGITPYPPHNRIPKTALGAIEFVNWEHLPDPVPMLIQAKKNGKQIIAVEQTKEAERFDQIEYQPGCILVLGHEISGVSSEILNICDNHVELPMFGHKRSLNVATTAGIISYHVALSFNK